MTFKIEKTVVPAMSEVATYLYDAYYADAYYFLTKPKNKTALHVWLDHASKTPAWVNLLMTLRNKVVRAFSIKDIGQIDDLDPTKSEAEYKVGDKVGIFTLLYLTEHEVILGDSDKHLDVKVSIYKEEINADAVSISTVVHVHNRLGKLYMLFVQPMHRLIVPHSIKHAEHRQ